MTDNEAIELSRRVEATLGDDSTANTDRRLKTAVHGFHGKWNSVVNEARRELTNYTKCPHCGVELGVIQVHGIGRLICKEHGLFGRPGSPVVDDGLTLQQWSWDNRPGQPWQADIERHVAEWRLEPRPFATDDALALTLLKKARLTVSPEINGQWMAAQCDCGSAELRKRMVGSQSGWLVGATIAEAVCRAWLAVAEKAEEQR